MVNSRNKGCAGEREAAKYLRKLGYEAERTAQHSGIEGLIGDVRLKNHFNAQGKHLTIEVKRTKWSSYGRKTMIDKWIEQTEAEESMCLLWRPDRESWRLGYRTPPTYVGFHARRNWGWHEGEEKHRLILATLIEILTERKNDEKV